MTELTQEEINNLSPRARKALGADNMIQEIVEVNPNAGRLKKVTTKKSKKKGNKNEKL
jgi:hypothetical protein